MRLSGELGRAVFAAKDCGSIKNNFRMKSQKGEKGVVFISHIYKKRERKPVYDSPFSSFWWVRVVLCELQTCYRIRLSQVERTKE